MSRDQNAVIMDRAALEREVERIEGAVADRGRVIRVLGSIAVALHCPNAGALIAGFKRTYADIDFVGYGRDAKEIAAAIGGLGYIEDRQIYIFSEGRRAIFDHPSADIHIDVFYDRLEFCHVIPLDGRLEADAPTIPLAELLLSKLQIVKLNEKDVVDAILLLLDHQLGVGRCGHDRHRSDRGAGRRRVGSLADAHDEPREGRRAGRDLPAARRRAA